MKPCLCCCDWCPADRAFLVTVEQHKDRFGPGSRGLFPFDVVDDLVQRVEGAGHLGERSADSLGDILDGQLQLIVAHERGRSGIGGGVEFDFIGRGLPNLLPCQRQGVFVFWWFVASPDGFDQLVYEPAHADFSEDPYDRKQARIEVGHH